jgi:hypothetical protein
LEQAVTQPRPARHWLTAKRLRRYPCAVLLLYLGIVAVGCYRAYWLHTVTMPTLHEDFAAFWSAGWLAVHGHALDAYDAHLLTQIEWQALHRQIAGVLPWLYPPTALFWFGPFSLLPYDTAAVVFLAFNVAAFVALAYATVPDPRTPLVALAFPGIVITLLSGQNGLLTAVLAGLGLLLLERRPAAAGCCFALLAFKPQLAVLIPLALLCARQWRALAACAVAFGLNWAAALLVFGPQTLPAFLHNLGEGAAYVSSGRYKLYRLPSFFVTAKLLHAHIALAYALQALSALTGAAAVIYAWGKPCPYALRAAVLICATLLVSPYLYDYDLTWYGILIAWYCRYALQAGFRRGEREWLIVLWSAPELGPLLAGTLSFQFMPFLALATLWMLVRRVASARHAQPVNSFALEASR